MDFFTKLNEKLDLGWKLADCECPHCKKQALFNPETDTFHCVKCDRPLPEFQRSSPMPPVKCVPEEKKFEEIEEKVNFGKNTRKNDSSSKLAQKLLEGWSMLEECCPDCFVPLMKPRKGPALCVSCGFEWDKDHKNTKPKEEILDSNEKNITEKGKNELKSKENSSKNLDKPRQIKENESKNINNKEVLAKQESALENMSQMILSISKLYKEKIDKACKEEGFEAIEGIINGPLEDLIRVQRKFFINYEKLKEIEKI